MLHSVSLDPSRPENSVHMYAIIHPSTLRLGVLHWLRSNKDGGGCIVLNSAWSLRSTEVSHWGRGRHWSPSSIFPCQSQDMDNAQKSGRSTVTKAIWDSYCNQIKPKPPFSVVWLKHKNKHFLTRQCWELSQSRWGGGELAFLDFTGKVRVSKTCESFFQLTNLFWERVRNESLNWCLIFHPGFKPII